MVWSAGAELTAAQLNTYLPQARSSWTPTVTASAGTFTTVSGAGRYIQFGKEVIWSLTVTITTVGTAAGYLQFTLPVTAVASTGYIGNGRSPSLVQAQVFLNTTSQARVATYNELTVCANGTLLLSGTYEAA